MAAIVSMSISAIGLTLAVAAAQVVPPASNPQTIRQPVLRAPPMRQQPAVGAAPTGNTTDRIVQAAPLTMTGRRGVAAGAADRLVVTQPLVMTGRR